LSHKEKYVRKRLKRKTTPEIIHKNRLVILNEDTFEEIFSLKLNLMNVLLWRPLVLFFDFSHYFIIAFTPLKFIPGYSSSKLKRCNCIGFKIRFINHRIKRKRCLYSIHSKDNGDIKFNKDSILAASEEVVPQVNYRHQKKNWN
jgi:hypothetical protein